jgi:hypothetical protein
MLSIVPRSYNDSSHSHPRGQTSGVQATHSAVYSIAFFM